MTVKEYGPFYTWVARHTSETEHEWIEFRGSVCDLLSEANKADATIAALVAALEDVQRLFDDIAAWQESAAPLGFLGRRMVREALTQKGKIETALKAAKEAR